MAAVFASEIIGHRRVMGDIYVVFGKFTNTNGATGGTVETGLQKVVFAVPVHVGTTVISDVPVFNDDFPTTSGDLTLVTVADTEGLWVAFGTP